MRFIIAFAITLTILGGCRKIGLVPEITPGIIEKRIELKNEKELPDKLLKYQSNIIFIQHKKNIECFDPLTGSIETLHSLQAEADESFFFQHDRMVLRNSNSKDHFIFNLKTKETEKIPEGFEGGEIIGLDGSLIIIRNLNQLILLKYTTGEIACRIDLSEETMYNCEFADKFLYFMSTKKFYTFYPSSGKLDSHTLDSEASSGFLLWNNHIYYGSKNRELIRYSLKQNKTVWKTKLPMNLVLKPEKAGSYIMVAPEDNNIYFFNKNATLYWWEKCNGTRLVAPVVMRENVAVFLLDQKLKFFNFKRRTVQDYTLKNPALSNPVTINDYLYFMSRATRKKGKTNFFIEKLGNQYHVKIKTEPEYVKPAGQSIQFTLSAINLIKPEMDIKIINNKQENIFKTSFKKNEMATFVWIPDKEGKYKMVLTVTSQNQKNLNIEKEFIIIDLGRIANESGRKAIEKCPTGKLN
jgi:hypothetical protein